MPINKLTTLLDLSRQSKIISGETATFDGKIQVGLPFSGYPTGVDVNTIVSLGVISSETAVFSGDTGTTVFDVSNVSSPNYNIIFDGFSATTWTNPIFSAYTSGLTLPITPLSAETQTVGPFWELTQTGMTGDYIIGTEYTGFSITYSFDSLSQIGTGLTYSGLTTATQENFSAGTLDYKGPLDYISSKEDATIDGRLTTNKITITNGASASTIGYVLTQTGSNGNGEWNSLSSLLSGTCQPLINIEVISGCSVNGLTIESDVTLNGNVVINGSATTINTEIVQSKDNNIVLNYSGTHLTAIGGGITLEDGVSNGVDSIIYTDSDGTWLFYPDLSATSGTILNFTADTISVNSIGDSGDCVTDIFVSNIHSCSPLNINPLDEGNVYFGSTSGVTIDVTNVRLGINNPSPQYILDISGTTNEKLQFITTSPTSRLWVSTDQSNRLTRIGVNDDNNNGGIEFGFRGTTEPTFVNYGKQGDSFIRSSNNSNGINIIDAPTTFPNTKENYIRFYAGQNADGTTPDVHIQGSGSTRGNVGIGTEVPSEKLDVNGKTRTTTLQVTSGATNGYILSSDSIGNATWQPVTASGAITGITISNNINNNLLTATGTANSINGEGNATFNGTTLELTKNSSNPNIIISDSGNNTTDAYIRIESTSAGTPSYAIGVDKSDSNKFKIAYASNSVANLGSIKLFDIDYNGGLVEYLLADDAIVFLTAPDGGGIELHDRNSTIKSSFTQFTNFSTLNANNGDSTNQPFYINNDSVSGLTSFGGGGVNDLMQLYNENRTDLFGISGGTGGLFIRNDLSVNGLVRVGNVTGTGVAVYRDSTTGILTTTSSDERVKQNIIQITGATEIVKNLRGVYYNWKNTDHFQTDDETRQIGLIAQEVEPHLPEAVALNGVSDYKTIKYSEMVSVLVEAVKEQQDMISDLKREIENLENRVTNLGG